MPHIDQQKIIQQAVEWLLFSQERPLSVEEQKQFDLWQQQSPVHAQVWEKAQLIEMTSSDVSLDLAIPYTGKVLNSQRQSYKRYLWLLCLIPSISAFYYMNTKQHWFADHHSHLDVPKSVIDIKYSDQISSDHLNQHFIAQATKEPHKD